MLADAIGSAWRGWYSSVYLAVRDISAPPSKGHHPLEPMFERCDLASFKKALDHVAAGEATQPLFNPGKD